MNFHQTLVQDHLTRRASVAVFIRRWNFDVRCLVDIRATGTRVERWNEGRKLPFEDELVVPGVSFRQAGMMRIANFEHVLFLKKLQANDRTSKVSVSE